MNPRLIASLRLPSPIEHIRFHPCLPLLALTDALEERITIFSLRLPDAPALVATLGDPSRTRHIAGDPSSTDWPRWLSIAWHPTRPVLAVTGLDRGVDLYHFDATVRLTTLGRHESARALRGPGWRPDRSAKSYACIGFDATGERLIAGGRGDYSEVLEVVSGALVGLLARADTDVVRHPEGALLAAFESDQGATLLRFAQLGGSHEGPAAPETYARLLALYADGYESLVFSPAGDALALGGDAYDRVVLVHEFPSLRRMARIPLESWDELRRVALDAWRPWCRVPGTAFTPGGNELLVGMISGEVMVVPLPPREPDVRTVRAHDGPIGPLAVDASRGLLATADLTGDLRLFQLEGPAARADTVTRPLTRAFLGGTEAVDPFTHDAFAGLEDATDAQPEDVTESPLERAVARVVGSRRG